jgi:hypothetical protein
MGCINSTTTKILLDGKFKFSYEKLMYNDEYEVYQGIEFMCDLNYPKFTIKNGHSFQYIIIVKQQPDVIFLSQNGVLSLLYDGKFLLNALDFPDRALVKNIKKLDEKYYSENLVLNRKTKELQSNVEYLNNYVNKTRVKYIIGNVQEPLFEGSEEDRV